MDNEMNIHLGIFHPDDGSTLLEWIAPTWRFGISIEPKWWESSWYLVSRSHRWEGCGYLLFWKKVKQ